MQVNGAPVIPDPIIHISASEIKAPSLPSFAKGFASGAESIQKDFVGFGTGRWAGGCEISSSSTLCAASKWFRGIDDVDITVDNLVRNRSSIDLGRGKHVVDHPGCSNKCQTVPKRGMGMFTSITMPVRETVGIFAQLSSKLVRIHWIVD
jgi:hypothetical protein